MSQLRLCLLVILVIGSSLAEADNEEGSAVEGTEAGATEGEEDRVEIAELEDKQVEEKELEDTLAEDKELNQEEVKYKIPEEEEVVKDPKSEDKQTENKAQRKKTNATRVKHKRVKDIRVKDKQVHAKNLKNKEVEAYEDEESMENNSSASDEDDEDDDEDDDDEILTRATCMNGLALPKLSHLCCHSQIFLDKDIDRCLQYGEPYMHSRNKRTSLRAALDIVECFYRKKKYIKSGDRLNVKRIRADAAKLNDPVRTEFMIKMYKTCDQLAKSAVKTFKEHRHEIKSFFHTNHEVFVFVIYTCVDRYLEQQSCPYFHWFGKTYAKDATCLAYAKECKKLVG